MNGCKQRINAADLLTKIIQDQQVSVPETSDFEGYSSQIEKYSSKILLYSLKSLGSGQNTMYEISGPTKGNYNSLLQ